MPHDPASMEAATMPMRSFWGGVGPESLAELAEILDVAYNELQGTGARLTPAAARAPQPESSVALKRPPPLHGPAIAPVATSRTCIASTTRAAKRTRPVAAQPPRPRAFFQRCAFAKGLQARSRGPSLPGVTGPRISPEKLGKTRRMSAPV
jgi:hypothetical protein